MANAMKCDRCGKYYNSYINSRLAVLYTTSGREKRGSWDLCEECSDKIRKFLIHEYDVVSEQEATEWAQC